MLLIIFLKEKIAEISGFQQRNKIGFETRFRRSLSALQPRLIHPSGREKEEQVEASMMD